MDWDLVLWGGMEAPMETCPFMSRLYLPRYLFFSVFSPFSCIIFKNKPKIGLG